MNGAIAVVSASTSTAAKTSIMMMMGKSHNFFLARKNRPNSVTIDMACFLLKLVVHALRRGAGRLPRDPVRVRCGIWDEPQSIFPEQPGNQRGRREQQIEPESL